MVYDLFIFTSSSFMTLIIPLPLSIYHYKTGTQQPPRPTFLIVPTIFQFSISALSSHSASHIGYSPLRVIVLCMEFSAVMVDRAFPTLFPMDTITILCVRYAPLSAKYCASASHLLCTLAQIPRKSYPNI